MDQAADQKRYHENPTPTDIQSNKRKKVSNVRAEVIIYLVDFRQALRALWNVPRENRVFE
jgi:hypothetical protein